MDSRAELTSCSDRSPDSPRPPGSPPHRPQDALFADFVASREDPRCPRCGYSLRGLITPACPECGDRLQLEVALVEPRMGAFITTIVALSLGFGGSMLFTGVALKAAPGYWWIGVAGILLVVQLVTTAIALPMVIARRRRFRRLANVIQWTLAIAACTVIAFFSMAIVVWFDD